MESLRYMNHNSYGVLKKLGNFYAELCHSIIIRIWNVFNVEEESEKVKEAIKEDLQQDGRGMGFVGRSTNYGGDGSQLWLD